MSQRNVENVIGRLVTDEGFRRQFTAAPLVALLELVERGVELNDCEVEALIAIDTRQLERFVHTVAPSIQKVEYQGGCS